MNLNEHVEKTIDKLRAVENELRDDARMSVFTARRYLQAGLFEAEKQGSRIAVRKEFEMICEVCKKVMTGEEEYYLHLRKAHKISEQEAAEHSNKPRGEYETDIQELRRLLAEYTDSDLEDDFTRGFTVQEANGADNGIPDNT